jgi:hypothetical protein
MKEVDYEYYFATGAQMKENEVVCMMKAPPFPGIIANKSNGIALQ